MQRDVGEVRARLPIALLVRRLLARLRLVLLHELAKHVDDFAGPGGGARSRGKLLAAQNLSLNLLQQVVVVLLQFLQLRDCDVI